MGVSPVSGECELIHCPLASNLEQLKAERERLSEVVKEQNISPEEVIRMSTEHEQLSRSLEDLKVKIAESQKTVLSLEVAVANRGAAAEARHRPPS